MLEGFCQVPHNRHCEEHLRRSNPSLGLPKRGLLRVACHRAALCAGPLARNDTGLSSQRGSNCKILPVGVDGVALRTSHLF